MRWVIVLLLLIGHADAKPTAPVTIELSQRSLGGSFYEVTLTARPSRDVEMLELKLDGRTRRVARARANATHTLTVRVQLRGTGRKVVGGAATTIAGRRRSVAEDVVIGKEPVRAAAPSKIVVMPDGTHVDEVRP